MKPDRVIVGTDNVRTAKLLEALYAPFARSRDKMIVMGIRSAEMTKYAANCMLATKISFMNEMANICEAVGADMRDVRAGIGSDRRIGYHFIYPGVGYGGSCFPKDVKALIHTAKESGYTPDLVAAVDAVNNRQKGRWRKRSWPTLKAAAGCGQDPGPVGPGLQGQHRRHARVGGPGHDQDPHRRRHGRAGL
jgi:UDPglucose 6-dehydrogenase